MSYERGYAALNLQMPDIIPRTEYSAESHWELIKAVTGLFIDEGSSGADILKAQKAFRKEWEYDFRWSTLISRSEFNDHFTKMGHGIYVGNGSDFDSEIRILYNDVEDVYGFDPFEKLLNRDKKTIVNMFETSYKNSLEHFPEEVAMTGVYVTCISGLLEVFGWDMLLYACGMDPDRFKDVLNRYINWVYRYFEALAESKVPVVMVHDDMVWAEGAIFHPNWYRSYVFPAYKKLINPLVESGKKIIFTSDGNYTQFACDIADCGVNGFVFEPLTDLNYMAEKFGKTHVLIGNADTRVLLYGNKDDIYTEVKRCTDIGRNCPGFFMAIGNHIPANTPVDNALYYNDIFFKLRKR